MDNNERSAAEDVTERERIGGEHERLLAQLKVVNEGLVLATLKLREQAEQVEAQRHLTQTVFDNAPAGIIVLDGRDLTVKWVNEAYRQFLKGAHRKGNLIGQGIQECAPCLEEGGLIDLYRNVVETGQPVVQPEYECFDLDSGGRTFWRFNLLPLPPERKGPNDLMVVLSEITEHVLARKQVEELGRLAQEQASRLEAMIESIVDGVVVFNAEGRPVQINAAAKRIVGLKATASRNWREYLPNFNLFYPDGRPVAVEDTSLARALQGEVVVDAQAKLVLPEGAAFHISSTASPVRDATGALSGAVVVIRDITERTKDEEARARLMEALRQSEEKFRRVIEDSEDGIVLIDKEGFIIEWNRAQEEIAGLARSEVLGRPIWDVQFRLAPKEIRTPERHAHIRSVISAMLENEEVSQLGRLNDQVVQRPDDTRVAIQVRLFPIRSESGFMIGGVSRDITQWKLAEAELCSTLDESRRRGEEVSALLDSARAVLEHQDFEAAARALFLACKNLIGAAAGYVSLVSEDRKATEVLFVDSKGSLRRPRPPIVSPIRGLRKKAILSVRAVYDNQFTESDTAKRLPEGHLEIESILLAPLVIKGEAAGLLGLANKPGGFDDNDARIASAFGELIAVAFQNSRTLESLEKSEQRLRAVVETATDAIISVDSHGRIAFWNPAAEILFGYSADEVNDKPLEEIMPERFRAAHKKGFDRIVSTGEARILGTTAEKAGLRKDGTEFPLEISLATWKAGEEKYFTAILRDTAERKRVEGALRESEERYRRLAENAQDFIFRYELLPARRFSYVNSACIKMTGYTPEEHYADPDLSFKIIHPDDRERFQEMFAGRSWGVPRTLRWRHKDGRAIWTEQVNVPVRDDAGRIVAVEGVVRDITERKRMEEELIRAQRLEAAGRIAGQVAHDFNNLLGPLLGYPELIRMSLPPDHKAVKYCDAMLEVVPQMLEISGDLLTLSRRGHVDYHSVDLNGLVQQVLEQIPRYLEALLVETYLAEDLLKVNGSSAQLLRVVSNLVSNAREAMGDIGILTVKTENLYVDLPFGRYNRVEVGEYVRLEVTDSGCGIPPEIKDKIFDAFFTTKTSGRRRGSGLGLSIVHTIVEDHGGYVDVESELGKGASFNVYLPVCRAESKPAAMEEYKGGNETILVVDDDAVQREVVKQLLQMLGYRASTVSNGEEAVSFLRERTADLLILDMIMPDGIDGAETFRQVKELKPETKAIILSGYAESERVRTAQGLGAGAYLRKPVTLPGLAQAVREELDRRG